MDTAAKTPKDKRVEIAIHHWAPRFVSSGVPLTDFDEVTAGITRWDEWCAAWSARAAVHEELGRKALADGFGLSAGEHLTRAAVLYHFGKFMFVHDLEEMKRAHRKVIECRQLALPHLPFPGERVEMPYQGKRLAASGAVDDFGDPGVLVTVVQGNQRFAADFIAMKQLGAVPGILAADRVGGSQARERAESEVLEMTDRPGNDREPTAVTGLGRGPITSHRRAG